MAWFIGKKKTMTLTHNYTQHMTLTNSWNIMLNRYKINFNMLVEQAKNSLHKSIKLTKFYIQTNLENTTCKTCLLITSKHFSEKLKEIKANEETLHVMKRQFITN